MAFISAQSLLPSSLGQQDRLRCKQALEGLQLYIGRQIPWVEAFAQLHWPHDTALVCDSNTWQALGETLHQALSEAGYHPVVVMLPDTPHADDATAQHIHQQAASCRALIAVGSGTINDLTKYTAHQLQKPYAVCGTAPSMNGYLSANAAMTVNGHKQSLAAALPCAALFDLDVLEAAPQRLRAAGLGDSICRSTTQADWMLSHYLLDTPYDPLPYALLAPYEESLLSGNLEALITTLLLSGMSMTLCGGSYPASQGEHLIAHYMDMRYPDIAAKSYHGEQIAVTTLLMSMVQHGLLAMEHPAVWRNEQLPDAAWCRQFFGEETGASVWKEWQAKRERLGDRETFNTRLKQYWTEIRLDIARRILRPATLEQALEAAHAPTRAIDIGWEAEQTTEAAHHAHLIRNRFTFLDLVALSRP